MTKARYTKSGGKLNCSAMSIESLEGEGYVVENVEHWIRGSNRTRDYIGCIDLLAFKPGVAGMLGVQATDITSVSKRRQKILDEPRARQFLLVPGNRIIVHGWGERGRGEARGMGCRVIEILVSEFNE